MKTLKDFEEWFLQVCKENIIDLKDEEVGWYWFLCFYNDKIHFHFRFQWRRETQRRRGIFHFFNKGQNETYNNSAEQGRNLYRRIRKEVLRTFPFEWPKLHPIDFEHFFTEESFMGVSFHVNFIASPSINLLSEINKIKPRIEAHEEVYKLKEESSRIVMGNNPMNVYPYLEKIGELNKKFNLDNLDQDKILFGEIVFKKLAITNRNFPNSKKELQIY